MNRLLCSVAVFVPCRVCLSCRAGCSEPSAGWSCRDTQRCVWTQWARVSPASEPNRSSRSYRTHRWRRADPERDDEERDHQTHVCVCVCVWVCVCVRVFVTNQDIDLYNDTGMTQVLQGEGDFSGHWPMSPLFKTLINHTEWGFLGESWNAQSPVRAKFRCRVGVGQ